MSALTAGMQTAVSQPKVVLFGAIQIDFPSYTLRLINGASTVTFNGGDFKGRDPTYGVLAAIGDLDDGGDDNAPALSVTLNPANAAAAADLSSANMQGARVRAWFGVVVRATGAVVADPYQLFEGEIDQPTLGGNRTSRTVEYDCVSAMERMFENDEGFRLSDANHQRVWPGEEGLEHMTGLAKQIFWGVASVAGASGGYGGGGGSGSYYANPVNLK